MIKNNKASLPERIEELVYLLHPKHRDGECLRVESVKQQINLLLAEVIDEVIGVDEPLPDPLNGFDEYETSRINNQLRAEIKARVKDMLGEK